MQSLSETKKPAHPAPQCRSAPLSGIRIIDFGHYIAGPLTGMLLADQGAEVIKIDRPGSNDPANPATSVYNRNKKRLELDLKQPDDLATARKLVQSADVVIENFRPGVMDRLELGAEAMTELNPKLVYLSLPGFAATDSERASIRAFEGVVGAATGLYTDLQPLRRLLDAPPIYTPIPLGSTYGAIHGAIAVTLALYARQESGMGDIIEVPLVGAAMSAMAIINLQVENQPHRYRRPPLSDTEQAKIPAWRAQVQQNGQQAIREIGGMLAGLGAPATGTYRAADGNWIYIIAGGHSRNSRSLLMVLGLYDGLLEQGMVDLPVYQHIGVDNNIPSSDYWSREWNLEIRRQIKAVITQQPAAHWVQHLTDVGVPCGIHRSANDWLHSPETDAAALTVEVEDADFGQIRQIGLQAWLSSTDPSYMQPKPVQQCLDPTELLIEENKPTLPSTSVSARTTGSGKPLLDGVRVLDLSNVLAGPASARTLAEYGAEVIKIDPPEPNFGPHVACYFPIEVSPGKRSMILDLKAAEGQQIFAELVKTADVVIHNFRPGVADRLKIDHQRLKTIKPNIVYVNLTAFGGPRPGPWMDRPGFDPLLQATTGIQMRYGGRDQTPILHGWASCIDYMTGYSATFGAVLALLRRRQNGQTEDGDFVTTSLAQSAQLVQVPLMVATADHQPGSEVQGQEAVGEHPLYRIYRAQDGWLFLAGLRSEKNKLQEITELQDLPLSAWTDAESTETSALAAALEAEIETLPVETWVRAFQSAGLGAHRVDSLADIGKTYLHTGTFDQLQEKWDDGRSISWIRITDHSVGGSVELTPPAYVRFQNRPIQLLAPAAKQGIHTREILLELGYSEEQIKTWLADGIIKEALHEHYLPG